MHLLTWIPVYRCWVSAH